jgi:hypothetical protein
VQELAAQRPLCGRPGGRWTRTTPSPSPQGTVFLNDVVIAPDGAAFVTDSVTPTIFRVAREPGVTGLRGGRPALPALPPRRAWSSDLLRRSVHTAVNWLTIEVFDGDTSAAGWARAWHDRLVEAAVTGGAVFWDEHEHRWGTVLEFAFADERLRDAFRQAPVVLAALDAAPDPVNGVLTYPHRGGGSGSRQPRRPHPVVAGGAAALPIPDTDRLLRCSSDPADATAAAFAG